MYGTDTESATDARNRMAAALNFAPSNLETGRTILWYEVRTHNADPLNYRAGVWPVWTYSDAEPGTPAAGLFGGPFAPLRDAPEWHYIEATRRSIFRAESMVEDFVSTALQDLQLSEADEACSEGREARDSGTIYTVDARTFEALRQIVARFRTDCADHIDAALELEPGEDGLRYGRDYVTEERLGSTLWLAVTGSGVTFTDDGDSPALVAMAEWARGNHTEGLYFGDAGGVHLI